MTFDLNNINLDGNSVAFTLESDGVVIDCSVCLDNASSFAGKVLGFKEDATPNKEKDTV